MKSSLSIVIFCFSFILFNCATNTYAEGIPDIKSFLCESNKDVATLTDFVKQHDESMIVEITCSSKHRKAILDIIDSFDLASCWDGLDIVSSKYLDTDEHCAEEIKQEIAVLEADGRRALRGSTNDIQRELWWAFIFFALISLATSIVEIAVLCKNGEIKEGSEWICLPPGDNDGNGGWQGDDDDDDCWD